MGFGSVIATSFALLFFFFSVSVFPLESPIFRGLEGAYEKTQWAKILTTLVLVWEKDAEF